MRRLALLVLVVACSVWPAAVQAQQRTVLDSVHVVDVEAGAVRLYQSIHIEDGIIRAITPAGIPLPPHAHRVAAPGRFAIPGLIDAHVHLRDPDPEIEGLLLIANGVTAVREMGSPLEYPLAFRKAVEAGDRIGPDIVIAAMVDGASTWRPFIIPIGTPAEADGVVRQLKARGVDQVKIYDRSITLETYRALGEASKRHGMPLVGHAPHGLEEAASVGQASVEHLRGVARAVTGSTGLVPAEPGSQVPIGWFGHWHLYHEFDSTVRRQRLNVPGGAHVVHVPTLVYYESLKRLARGEDRWADPRLRYVRGERPLSWAGFKLGEADAAGEHFFPNLQEAVRDLRATGATIVAGTDYHSSPFNVAGFSLHRELELLAEAGLDPAEALRAATTHAAALLGLGSRQGLLREGYAASIVLLDANPLDDIRHTRDIRGLFHAGRYYDRGALDRLLAEAEERAGADES